MTKEELYKEGVERATAWLRANCLPLPIFQTFAKKQNSDLPLVGKLTGYYDPQARTVNVNIAVTARPNPVPHQRSWSYPGNKVDRTATGVVCHEVGHHVEAILARKGRLPWSAWKHIAATTKPITSYEPNPAEAFAETIRLFILNPDLLRTGRPERYFFLIETLMLKPKESRPWREVLNNQPDYVRAAERWGARAKPSLQDYPALKWAIDEMGADNNTRFDRRAEFYLPRFDAAELNTVTEELAAKPASDYEWGEDYFEGDTLLNIMVAGEYSDQQKIIALDTTRYGKLNDYLNLVFDGEEAAQLD
jgi:hypothetical protein